MKRSRDLEKLSDKRNQVSFFEMVYSTARQVPRGKVTTYSSIAKHLGNPRGSRAVGWAMRVCPYEDVPCHRVVRSDGLVSGYPDDVRVRIAKLRKEGIRVFRAQLDVPKHFFDDFEP